MPRNSVVERAFEVAAATFPRAARDGLAHPFGFDKPPEPYHWRVSQDVWAELVDWAGIGDPKGPSADANLLGEPIKVDDDLPPNSMVLERLP